MGHLALGLSGEAPPGREVAVSLVPDEHDATLGAPLLEVRQPLLVQLPRVLRKSPFSGP